MSMLYFTLTVLYFIHGGSSQKDEVICELASSWFKSVDMSVNLVKRGFHRELLYKVQHDPAANGIKALLIQKLPSGVYMDQYELASLKEDTGLEVLLDSVVSLEDPEYLSSGFSALIFLSPVDEHPGLLQARVPVHGRYHRPSSSGGWAQVIIEPPQLLLQSEHCKTQPLDIPHRVVKAPCTVRNQRVCSWLEIQGLPVPDSMSLEIPVGDFSMIIPVCAGTVLTTLLCCVFICRAVWKHGMF